MTVIIKISLWYHFKNKLCLKILCVYFFVFTITFFFREIPSWFSIMFLAAPFWKLLLHVALFNMATIMTGDVEKLRLFQKSTDWKITKIVVSDMCNTLYVSFNKQEKVFLTHKQQRKKELVVLIAPLLVLPLAAIVWKYNSMLSRDKHLLFWLYLGSDFIVSSKYIHFMPYLDHYISNTQSDRTSDKDQKIWEAEVGDP